VYLALANELWEWVCVVWTIRESISYCVSSSCQRTVERVCV